MPVPESSRLTLLGAETSNRQITRLGTYLQLCHTRGHPTCRGRFTHCHAINTSIQPVKSTNKRLDPALRIKPSSLSGESRGGRPTVLESAFPVSLSYTVPFSYVQRAADDFARRGPSCRRDPLQSHQPGLFRCSPFPSTFALDPTPFMFGGFLIPQLTLGTGWRFGDDLGARGQLQV